MLKLSLILLTFVVAGTAHAAAPLCAKPCRADALGGQECAGLSYYINNCSRCRRIGYRCAKAFCGNFSNSCTRGKLFEFDKPNISVNSHEENDVCSIPLFPRRLYGEPGDERGNENITILSLNALDYEGLSQTRGGILRALNTIRLFVANYLVANSVVSKEGIVNLEDEVTSWLNSNSGINTNDPNQLTFQILNTLAEQVRVEIFKLKGIDTQTKIAYFTEEGKEAGKESGYVMTVSNLGCLGEIEQQ